MNCFSCCLTEEKSQRSLRRSIEKFERRIQEHQETRTIASFSNISSKSGNLMYTNANVWLVSGRSIFSNCFSFPIRVESFKRFFSLSSTFPLSPLNYCYKWNLSFYFVMVFLLSCWLENILHILYFFFPNLFKFCTLHWRMFSFFAYSVLYMFNVHIVLMDIAQCLS